MKICFIIPEIDYSGAPKMIAWLANKMAEKGHKVEIIAFFSGQIGRPLNDKVSFSYLGIHKSKNRFIRNTFGMIKTLKALNSKIKKSNPDIIVSFLDSVSYCYLAYNKLFGKRKIVVSERADPSQYKGITSKISFRLMKKADGFVFQTNGAKEFFNKMLNGKGKIIPNPVTIKRSQDFKVCNFDKRDNRIVSVGRLNIYQKRQDIMLRAFKIVNETHPEIKLYLYGNGSDKDTLQDMINTLQLQNSVVLAGKIDCVEENIYNAKAFVLTSDFEGIPNALIEAMSVGVPSVSTDCSPGGAALLIENGVNGFLVNRGDVTEIANKLNILIENKEISDKFSANAPKIAEKFAEDRIATEWEDYLTFIGKG